jgi:uncharacterized protein YggE
MFLNAISYNRLIVFPKKAGEKMNSEQIASLSNGYNRKKRQTLKVTGEATLQATPDQAIITLGVHTENIDPKLAQQENSQTIAQVLSALKALGIAEENIKTSDYRMDPQYNYVDGKEIFQHYKVEHMLQVKTRDIEKVGTIVDSLVKQGANSVSSVRFSLSNSDIYYNRALSLALKNAYEKAHTLTKTIEATLQPTPVHIEELSAPTPPVLYQASAKMSTTTPFMPGELQITATLRVDYTY